MLSFFIFYLFIYFINYLILIKIIVNYEKKIESIARNARSSFVDLLIIDQDIKKNWLNLADFFNEKKKKFILLEWNSLIQWWINVFGFISFFNDYILISEDCLYENFEYFFFFL